MPFAPTTKFDHYEIIALLGKGGMGEVFRAKDTRLNREVAIKILPSEVAQDAERLRRFEIEAKAVGTLNHPNILTVHDFGLHEGTPYLVMELLEGEELRAQLDNGALPVRKAIDYAQQIATGLAAAHAKNIVHRDLKPANLFVTTDGRVKILDFGLAKLMKSQNAEFGMRNEEADTLIQGEAKNPQSAIRNPHSTDPGVVMGTVGYMSPEQVQGQIADHRSDIFSFGVILYEMLSGQRAFTGSSMVETMHAILKDEPPELSEINAKISPALDRIVRRCLEKKPELRFQTASDLGFALSTLTTPSSSSRKHTEAAPALATTAITPRSSNRERLAWIGFGVASLLALLAVGTAYFRRPTLDAEPLRLFVNPPEKATRFDWPTISPDGRTLAFIATVEGKTQLWVRPLNSTTAKPLTDLRLDVAFPSWSSDGQFLSYYEERKLKKIALAGGAPVTLCDMEVQSRGTWNREGVIVFGAGPAGLKRISASGGAVTAVTTVDSAHGQTIHGAPAFLPDGRHFLFTIGNTDPAKMGVYLGSLDGGETKQLLTLDNPIFALATNPLAKDEGYLFFARQGALLAQPYDFSRNQLLGEPMRLAEKVQISASNFAKFSVSTTGTLVLLEGYAQQQLTWVDRTGKKLGTVGQAGFYDIPRLSTDNQHLAVGGRESLQQGTDIRLFDLARGTDARFTFDPANDQWPLWSPDGSRLLWTSSRKGPGDLYWKAASGAGQDEVLWKSAMLKQATDWSADGRFVLYRERHPQTNIDLWVLPLEGERQPQPWLTAPFNESLGKFSPDGKWIAYVSDEAGGFEVYLQAFVPGSPAAGGKWQISKSGGVNPNWRRDGRELYFVSGDKMMAVDITLGTEVKVGTPQELFSLSSIRAVTTAGYAKTGDGQRFLFVTNAEEASVPPFTVVLNWMAEMKK